MAELRRETGGGIRLRMGREEAGVLRSLVAQMDALLRLDNPGDPAVGRLFPDAFESHEESREYRALVGDELKAGKLRALQTVAAGAGTHGGVDTTVSEEDVHAWLTALTDMRLAIGTRIDVTEELMAAELDPEDPRFEPLSVLHWLGWLQESILRTIDPTT